MPVTAFLSSCKPCFPLQQQLASATPSRLKFRRKQSRKKKYQHSTAQHDFAKRIRSIFQFKRLRSGDDEEGNRVSAQGPLKKGKKAEQTPQKKSIPQQSASGTQLPVERDLAGRQADQHVHIGLIDAGACSCCCCGGDASRQSHTTLPTSPLSAITRAQPSRPYQPDDSDHLCLCLVTKLRSW